MITENEIKLPCTTTKENEKDTVIAAKKRNRNAGLNAMRDQGPCLRQPIHQPPNFSFLLSTRNLNPISKSLASPKTKTKITICNNHKVLSVANI